MKRVTNTKSKPDLSHNAYKRAYFEPKPWQVIFWPLVFFWPKPK